MGFAKGNCTIENCLVKTNIEPKTTTYGVDYVGGIIGHARTAGITMRGCVYTGTINATSGGQVGGLIGWSDGDNNPVTITNCFFKGTVTGTAQNFHPIMNGTRSTTIVTLTNTYHNRNVSGTPQTNYSGSRYAYSITGTNGVDVANRGTATTYGSAAAASIVTGYNVGLQFDGVLYAGSGQSVPLYLGCPGYNITGYSASPSGLSSGTTTGWKDSYTLTMPSANTVISATKTTQKFHVANSSTSTTMTWEEFAAAVNAGTSYSGQTVYLDEDISGQTAMVGLLESGNTPVAGQSFSGTFEGQGHTLNVNISNNNTQGAAPFRGINGATIQNLVVSGSVTQHYPYPHASGLVGMIKGTNTIKNCLVHTNVTNTSTDLGNRHIGGLTGHALTSTLTIEGCVYDGTLQSEHPKGGLIGWSSGSTLTLTNSFFNGRVTGPNTSEDNHFFHPIGCKDSEVPTVTVNNCYYTLSPTLADNNGNCVVVNASNKGKFAYTITGAAHVIVARRDNTTATYNVSKLNAYNPAFVYDGTLYAANGESIPLNLSCPGYSLSAYTANHGTLSGTAHTGYNDPYTLSMQAYNTVISVTNLQAKFHIANAASSTQMTWAEFAAVVIDGTTYSGQTVYLDEDIVSSPATVMVGSLTNKFKGTFDGQCYTLTVNLPTSNSVDSYAPFCKTENAVIKNLKVTGSVNTSYKHASGLIAIVDGTCTITNCDVNVTINSTVSGESVSGGFVAETDSWATLSMVGCAFTGAFNGSNASCWGGFVGWNYGHASWMDNPSQGCKATFTNCLFAPSSITVVNTDNATISRGWNNHTSDITINNCYYLQQLGLAQGKHGYILNYAASPAAGGTVSHNLTSTTPYDCSSSGITPYTFGLGYDIDNDSEDELILGNGERVTLIATPNTDYTFMNWIDNTDYPIVNPYAVTMGTADRDITAHFVNQKTGDDWTYVVTTMPSSGISIGSNTTISNANGLAWFISLVNGLNGQEGSDFSGNTVTLTADIDMGDHTWVPVGTTEHPFSGTFNGNGHVITGIRRTAEFPHQGLFGYVNNAANIQNVVVSASFTGNSITTGAIAGTFASTGVVANAEGAGTLTGGALTQSMGGLVGDNTSGTIHSSFAVATLTGAASTTKMGGLVGTNSSDLYNSYSNATYAGSSTPKGGLAGANSGTVENCYAAGIVSGVSALAGSNSGTIQYCYADAVGDGYVGTSGIAPSGCGLYGAVQSSIKHLNYMYRDNLITKGTNTYVGSNDAVADGITVYVANHIPVWNGLVSALNQWVRANPHSISGLAPWYRPLTTSINGDLPVLGFKKGTSLGAVAGSPKALRYGTMDGLLTFYNGGSAASIFHYGKAKGVSNVPSGNVSVYVAEDAVLLQSSAAGSDFANTTVGVTFDNSDHGQHAFDFWGNRLMYDWHFMSSPLNNPLTGAEHSSYIPSGNANSDVDITAIGGYFPTGLPMALHDADWKWDFYSYYEPEYHWINLKRNKKNHYHQDGGALITYNEADQDLGDHTAHLIPGKGYMMAVSQTTYMNQGGTLNRGNVPVTLTNQEPDDIGGYGKGWNLVGNPYQAYLDLEAMDRLPVYIYDAEMGAYVPYAKSSSSNPVTPSRYIHPHQAFFMHAAGGSATEAFMFEQGWADTTSTADSYYREGRPNYPLVNLFAENGIGQRDLAVVEFHRPEAGGAEKFEAMRSVPFTLSVHHEGKGYGVFYATDELERVPLHFKAEQEERMTLTWSTHNGVFTQLYLVDNMTGVSYDMLTHDSYSFTAQATDYASRFYITYECSGTGVEEDGGADDGSFAYVSGGNIVVEAQGYASLQVIDMFGRVVYGTVCAEGLQTVPTSHLAKGVYVVRLSTGKGVKTQKIVLQ